MNQMARMLATLLLIACFSAARANHPESGSCPDTHNPGPESLAVEVTIRDTGQPVSDGDVIETGTWLRFHFVATAYGSCQTYHLDASSGTCVAGMLDERVVGSVIGALNADTSGSLNGNYYPINKFNRDPVTGVTAFYHVLDTHDLTTTSGPYETYILSPGRYTHIIKNAISDTICDIPPDEVIKTITFHAYDGAKDEDLGCRVDATVGNPCHVASGNKYQKEVDSNEGPFPIVRNYNSQMAGLDVGFGRGWITPYHRRLQVYWTSGGAAARHRTADGYSELFTRTGASGLWVAEADSRATMTEDSTGYTVNYSRRSRDRFNLSGRLVESTNDSGQTIILNYDASGTQLDSVVDAYGHQLIFTYADGHVASIDNGAGIYSYTYDATKKNLLRAAFPDGTWRDYLYEHTTLRHHLTGIVDEAGIRWGTYSYDSSGRVTASQHPGGAGDVALAYTNSSTTSVTDALGVARNFTYSKIKGGSRITGVGGSSCAWCKPSKATTYDTNANPTSRTDWLNRKTCYSNDTSRNLELIRLEGLAPSLNCPANLSTYTPTIGTRQRKITTQWHATRPVPLQIDEPGRRTTFTYDAAANELSRTQLDTSTSESRTWTKTYDSAQRLLTVDGPRTDVTDVTSYAYYSCTTGFQCGQLQTVTNALGHVSTYNSYNALGQPLTITDPNGTVTTLTYDLRSRLTTSTVGGEQTLFEYWPTGTLKKVTTPDGSFFVYSYDTAHRLTGIEDAAGNRISFILDAMGNRTGEQSFDASNTLVRTRSAVFDSANRLWKVVGATGTSAVTTTYGYDSEGNATSIVRPMGRTTTQVYDELNRLTQVTDPMTGTTQQSYNALDQITSVTDPRGKVTSYVLNALGDLLQQVSPDSGTTSLTYDSGGNVATTTDARSKTGSHSYDALNRLTGIVYADQTIALSYDSGSNQKGRLMQMTDGSGSTTWTYDARGRVTSRQQSMGVVKTLSYSYDSSGRRQALTLPSGNQIAYGYTDGQVTSLLLNGSTSIISNALYQPFGPTRGWTWGNATSAIREYNPDGQVTDIDSAGLTSYDYDDAFRVTGITDATNSALSQTLGYDLLDRLISASNGSYNHTWTHDANGNRLSQGGSAAAAYTVSSLSNRLASVSGALVRNYTYDNAGHTTADGSATYAYNDAGRMTSATKASVTTTYSLNAFGERVKKSSGGVTRYFVHDDVGHLIGEYDGAGAMIQETIWLGDIPVATLRPAGASVNVYYIHTDHLNTPRRITRPSDNVVVWRWDSDPFGASSANEDPDGDSAQFESQLRFAGQYFDSETGLHYNHFRDYEPGTGRYIQSDPVGLGGGLNPFAYVGGNPVANTDPLGLCKNCGIEKAPGYDKQGTVPGGTRFSWNATFKNDADHDPKCCEVRQDIQWNRDSPPHNGFGASESQPNTWYEDRDVSGNVRYGHRTGPYADGGRSPDDRYRLNGYHGSDRPAANIPLPGVVFRFRLRVVDVCNGEQTIFTSQTLNVDMGGG